MTNEDILRTALQQSAEDLGCRPEDFLSDQNTALLLNMGPNAKKYYVQPLTCNFISYGNNIVAAATEETLELVREYIGRYQFYHCFETPDMHWLDSRLAAMGHRICFMAEYYLPDVRRLRALACDCELRVLTQPDFEELYLPEWSNAICKERKHLDVLGVGAYDGGRLVGMAGCSADAEEMWQIGVDVLPEYRRRGIASAVTSRLALEILDRGKVPFYCSAWSNIRSVKNAVRSGFIPTWAEMSVKPADKVEEMLKAEI